MEPFSSYNGQQSGYSVLVPHAVLVQPDKVFPPRRSEPDGLSPWRNFNASRPKQLEQLVQTGRLVREGTVYGRLKLFPVVGWLYTQPLVVALAPRLGTLHNGVAVLNTDTVTEPPHRPP